MGPKREEADRPVKAAEDRGKRSGARPHLLGRQPLTSLRGSPSSSPNEELDWGSWVLEFHGPITYQKPNGGYPVRHQLFIPVNKQF